MTHSCFHSSPHLPQPTVQSKNRRLGWWYTITLGSLVGVPIFSIDSTLATIPTLAEDLGTNIGNAQLTISLYLAGYAMGQIPLGFASDLFGRRKVVIFSLGFFILAGLACSLATSIEIAVLARFLQGIFGSSGAVVSRALARDLTEGNGTGRIMSLITTIIGMTMIIAPLIGSLIMIVGGWRATFGCSVLLGLIAWVLTYFVIAETRKDTFRPAFFTQFLDGSRTVLRTPQALMGILLACLTVLGLFSYITTSSELFIINLGLSSVEFAGIFAVVAIGYTAGGFISRKLGQNLSVQIQIKFFAGAYFLVGLLWVGFYLLGLLSLPVIVALLFLTFGCIGALLGLSTALTLERLPHIAGLAAGISGTMYLVAGSSYSSILAQFGTNALHNLLLTFTTSSTLMFALALAVIRK